MKFVVIWVPIYVRVVIFTQKQEQANNCQSLESAGTPIP